MGQLDKNVFGSKKFSDILEEIYNNQKKKEEQISTLISELFPKIKDAQVADAILSIFASRDQIDIFNKKALYIYIREMVDVKTPHITRVANQLGNIFKKHFMFYKEYGYTDFE